MTSLSKDLREKVSGLYTFAELFGFNWHDGSDWTWPDVAHEMADRIDAEEAEMLEDIDTLFNKVDEYAEWHCDIADMLDVEIDISDMSNAPTDREIQAGVMMALRSLKRNAECVKEAESPLRKVRPDSWDRIWEDYVNLGDALTMDKEDVQSLLERAQKLGGKK